MLQHSMLQQWVIQQWVIQQRMSRSGEPRRLPAWRVRR
jgi:hypothetical protein